MDDGTIEGEVVPCPDCGVDLEVVKIDGEVAKVEIAEIASEDWGE
ncbi:MAG: lysine biosynthesis protein LysW [Promethearchaeota archaeon]|nr:MAG: lysine biosynthesis protein LysW [Candidatus Lokiarchaeota archaeon]